jgi:2-methylcitrate dehydratase PrpD
VIDRSTGPTRALAERLVAQRESALPRIILERARQSILDWMGVTVGGATTDAARIAGDLAIGECDAGPSHLIGRRGSTTAQLAALANGVAGHALDFDDGSYWMMGHPSVAVLPAAFALAEALDRSGADLVGATVAGFDAASIVGLLVGKSHYLAGWHATGTIGTFGAAAAAAHLLRLDVEQTEHALGLAATQAAALKMMNGTMGKPFHAGRAAMSGVLAAQLAGRGFTVAPDAIEVEQGFAWTASTTFDGDAPIREMGERFGIEAVSHKRHACCGGTHPTIDALSRLRRDHRFKAADVVEVRLAVSPMIASMCIVDIPRTGLEGKFSLRYCAALALLGRSTGIAAFTDAGVMDQEVADVVARIVIEPLERRGPVVEIDVRLRDGRRLVERSSQGESEAEQVPRVSDAELADHWQALCVKFRDLVTPSLGFEVASELVGRLSSIEDEPSVVIMAPLLQPSRPS